MSPYMISIMLFVYGLANIIGNILAGRLLTIAPVRTVIIYPFALMILYFVFFFVSIFDTNCNFIVIWGVLAGLVVMSINIG